MATKRAGQHARAINAPAGWGRARRAPPCPACQAGPSQMSRRRSRNLVASAPLRSFLLSPSPPPVGCAPACQLELISHLHLSYTFCSSVLSLFFFLCSLLLLPPLLTTCTHSTHSLRPVCWRGGTMVNSTGDWRFCGPGSSMEPVWAAGGFSPCFLVGHERVSE